MLLSFEYKAKNELEKDGRSTAPLYGEKEIVCPNCHRTLKESEAESRLMTCICGHHFRIGARKRLGYMTDEGSFSELFGDIEASDPLSFPGYGEPWPFLPLLDYPLVDGQIRGLIAWGQARHRQQPSAVFSYRE